MKYSIWHVFLQALFDAVFEGDFDIAIEAIMGGADLNSQREYHGNTPLIEASRRGRFSMVLLLLDAVPDVNAVNNKGATALYVAAEEGHSSIVRALLQAKSDVNIPARNGTSPLMAASQRGHSFVVRFLLERGANPNAASDSGVTALHFTTSLIGPEGEQMAEDLLNAGADIDAVDDRGWSAVTFASYYGNAGIVQLLIEHGSDPASASDEFANPKDVICGCMEELDECPGNACEYQPTIDSINELLA